MSAARRILHGARAVIGLHSMVPQEFFNGPTVPRFFVSSHFLEFSTAKLSTQNLPQESAKCLQNRASVDVGRNFRTQIKKI